MSGLRADLAIIAGEVAKGARVLDVGCGDGALMAALRDQKQVDARGMEIDRDNVAACVARGQLLGNGHHPAEHQRDARAPLREIGEGHKGPRANPQQLLYHKIGAHGRLQCL